MPSIVFGLWGIFVIRPFLLPLTNWLNHHLGWIPVLQRARPRPPVRHCSPARIVLAVMIIPIITAISREIFLQTPRLHEEAALAMGATKWEMIRLAVFPYARSGMISAILLGLGRALGETMAIALIVSPSLIFSLKILTDGQNSQTVAANIALNFPDANTLQRQALIGTGLMLFVISFAVNLIARMIVSPHRARLRRARRPSARSSSCRRRTRARSCSRMPRPAPLHVRHRTRRVATSMTAPSVSRSSVPRGSHRQFAEDGPAAALHRAVHR